MKIKSFKKMSSMFLCGAVMTAGFASINVQEAYADTSVDSNAENGTITISGFDTKVKSFQIYNYNSTPITYKGRNYKVGALIAIMQVKDGTASITGLPYGTYKIKEYKTTTGYSASKISYTVTLEEGGGNEDLDIEGDTDNDAAKLKGSIVLTGKDGISLKDMSFQLKNIGDSSVVWNNTIYNVNEVMGTYKSKSDVFEFKNLPYGVYELKQTDATSLYYKDDNVYTINIVNGSPVNITIQVSNHNHAWDGGVVTKDSTCTENGVLTYTCTICGETRTEVIEKTGHTYYTKNPTCVEKGYRTCLTCNETMEIPITGHKWDAGVLHGTESCDGNPYRLHTCEYCGKEKRVAIPRELGHSYESSLTKATPDADGGIIKVCKKCGYVQTDKNIAKIDRIELAYSEATYTGTTVKPAVTVYDSNGKKIPSSYYTVNYYNNINVGTATVKVDFKGNYSGTLTEDYMILPRGTSILSLNAIHGGFTVRWAMQNKQTTGYELQYATREDFKDVGILQTTKYTTLTKTVSSLKPGTKYYVRIRTYKGSSYSAWSDTKTVTTLK